MISFDSLTLKAFIEENRDFFVGARIQKIQQPTRRELIFNLRQSGESRKLYININPQIHHICFLETDRHLEIPQKPPMFCMQLRKYLENSKIIRVNQPNYERIFEIYIETFNELGDKIELCLATELMGKHSNIILYNADTNIIIGCAHNVGAEKSREREMAGTLPYIYPPKQNKLDILKTDVEMPLENFYFFSKAFAKQCEGQTLEKIKSFVRLENLTPAISEDFSEFCLFSELLKNAIPCNSINEMIDRYFAHHIEKNSIKALRSELKSILNKKLQKVIKNKELMLSQLKAEEKGEEYRKWGDLIMANLSGRKDFSPNIQLQDWESGAKIEILLDPTLTLKENANKFFKKYTKSKKAKEKLIEMLEENEIQASYLEQTSYAVVAAQTLNELDEIRQEIMPVYQVKTTPPTILEREINGFKVYIGRNNKQNDFIVSKLAKDEDYWFHTHNCAGSHVLLKCPNPTEELIFECAKLAKEYSSASLTSKVGVIYTQRKNIKKPPKSPLGYVTYKGEEEILV